MRKLSVVTNNVLRSQANGENTISSATERIISPSGLKNNTKINKKIKKTRLEAFRSELGQMTEQEARKRIEYYFGAGAFSDQFKTAQRIIGLCLRHIEDGHFKRHYKLRETYTEWQEEGTDERGYRWMRNRKITKSVCPNHKGRLWLNVSQAEIAKALGVTRECVNRSIKKLERDGILDGEKYDKEVKGVYIDHTVALTLTKDYYKLLNRRWFSTKNSRIQNSKSQPREILSLKGDKLKINQGDWDSVESIPQSFFKKEENSLHVKVMIEDLRSLLWEKLSFETNKRVARMLGALRNQCFPTRESWYTFLKKVASCWYIMRDGFELTIDWLLSFRTVRRILSGGFGIAKDDKDFAEEGKRTVKLMGFTQERLRLAKKLEKECKTWQTRKKSRSFRSETPNYNNGSPSYATKLTRR